MKKMRSSTRAAAVGLLLSVLGASAAWAESMTLLTFADPAVDYTTPLFSVSGNSLAGSWLAQPGLTLETPGLPAGDFTDAQFQMSSLAIGAGGVLPAGTIEFLDSAGDLLCTIEFDSGQLFQPFGFGASDFQLNNVRITGDIVPFPLSDESIAFSFANRNATANGTTYTASFTSSAVPEPASLALLLGCAVLAGRFRRSGSR